MCTELEKLFNDETHKAKIRKKLPELFHLAEEESKRDGKIGMEVGTIRERVIVSMLMHFFGEERINPKVPTTEAEKDLYLDDNPISVKTITASKGNAYRGVKASWTVDYAKAREFVAHYYPSCDLLLTVICWSGIGGLYYIPLAAQNDILTLLGRDEYFTLPKEGTNPRGVEYSGKALQKLCEHELTQFIEINWNKPSTTVNIYERWLDLWDQE